MFEKRKNREPESSRSQALEESFSGTSTTNTSVSRRNVAVIGPQIHINGDIGGDEDLLIEGRVDGKIHLDAHQVDVGEGGRVNADIKAKVIKIAGVVHGDLTGMEKVVISRSGNVKGNIVTPRMVLEDGAIFKGGIDMDPDAGVKPVVTKSTNPKVEKNATKPKAVAADMPKEKGKYSLHSG